MTDNLTPEEMEQMGFTTLEEYNEDGTAWAASKAHLNDWKKREEIVLGEIPIEKYKSESERVRLAKQTSTYKDYLIHLEAAERDFLERDCKKRQREMTMDFLRSAMSMEREMVNRTR